MILTLMAGQAEVDVPWELAPFAYGQLKALGYKRIVVMNKADVPYLWIITWEDFCEDENRLYDPRYDVYGGM